MIVRCRLLVGACSHSWPSRRRPTPATPAPKTQYYLSMGDSYAVGYQATVRRTTLNGPANQLVPLAAKRGYRYKLVNIAAAAPPRPRC